MGDLEIWFWPIPYNGILNLGRKKYRHNILCLE